MFEELYQPLPDRQAYLSRIGYPRETVSNPDELNELTVRHLCTVPFENMEVLLNRRPPSLGVSDLFDKVVTNRRGGYCYELNALYFMLLKALGLDAYPVTCRITRGKDFLPPFSHRGSVVRMDGKKYFVDVGYGGPCPVGILSMEDGGEQQVRSAVFRVTSVGNEYFIDRKQADGSFMSLMRFPDRPADPVDFVPLNFYTALKEGSVFGKAPMVSIHTEHGNKAVSGMHFHETVNGEDVRVRDAENESELFAILKEEFGIAL